MNCSGGRIANVPKSRSVLLGFCGFRASLFFLGFAARLLLLGEKKMIERWCFYCKEFNPHRGNNKKCAPCEDDTRSVEE